MPARGYPYVRARTHDNSVRTMTLTHAGSLSEKFPRISLSTLRSWASLSRVAIRTRMLVSRASITCALGDGFIHFLHGVAAGCFRQDSHEFLQSSLLSLRDDLDRPVFNFKIQSVSGLEIEFLPDFRGDGDLSFAGDRRLHHLRKVRGEAGGVKVPHQFLRASSHEEKVRPAEALHPFSRPGEVRDDLVLETPASAHPSGRHGFRF